MLADQYSGSHLSRRRMVTQALSLALYHALGWWQADRIAALAVAAIAAAEAWHTGLRHDPPG